MQCSLVSRGKSGGTAAAFAAVGVPPVSATAANTAAVPPRAVFKNTAFSLVEIMIVIVIIGLLAGVVTVNVRSSMTKAKVNIAKHEIATIVESLNQYWSENGSYPAADQGLAALHQRSEKSLEPYLTKEPIDPWGRPYVYNNPGRKGPFEVIAVASPDHPEISSDDLGPKDAAK